MSLDTSIHSSSKAKYSVLLNALWKGTSKMNHQSIISKHWKRSRKWIVDLRKEKEHLTINADLFEEDRLYVMYFLC